MITRLLIYCAAFLAGLRLATASLAYTPFKTNLMKGSFDMQEAGNDIRVALLMTNTTADTEEDAEFVATFATLDEMDGANYVRKNLGTQAVNMDTVNNRGEFDAVDVTWTALGAGTRSIAGFLVFKFVTNDAASPNIAFIDSGGFPIAANGGDLTIQFNAEGILQVT